MINLENLDDKRIKSLDNILRKCMSNPFGPVRIEYYSDDDKEYLRSSIQELINQKLIKESINNNSNSFSVSITKNGRMFVENNSFAKQKERKLNYLKTEKLYKRLNLMLPIITSIAGVIIGVLLQRLFLC